MRTYDKFYIGGQWVEPIGKGTSDVINPATGEISATVPYGNAEDVDAAVTAARKLRSVVWLEPVVASLPANASSRRGSASS